MSKTTSIPWADKTWNPWQGCHKVSAACANCYMYRDKKRYGQEHWESWGDEPTEEELDEIRAIIARYPRFSPVNDLEYALAFVQTGQKRAYMEGMA